MNYDDQLKMDILSGTFFTGQPSPFIVYEHIYIGLLLSRLYSLTTATPWYPLFLYMVQFAGYTFILYALLKMRFSWGRWLVFVLLLFSVFTYTVIYIDFMATASLAVYAGLFLLALFALRPRFYLLPMAAVMLVAGYMVREAAFPLALFFCGVPLAFFVLWQKQRKRLWPVAVMLGVCALAIVGLRWTNVNYYKQRPSWSGHLAFTQQIIKLYDYGYMPWEGNESYYKEIGWDKGKYGFYHGWLTAEPRWFSLEETQRLLSHNSFLSAHYYTTRHWAERFQQLPFFFSMMGILSFVFCLGLWFFVSDKGLARKLILLQGGATLAGVALLLLYFKISEPAAFMIICVWPLLFLLLSDNFALTKTRKLTGLALLLCVAGVQARYLHHSQSNRVKQADFDALMQRLDKSKVYVWWGKDGYVLRQNPFADLQRYKGIRVLFLASIYLNGDMIRASLRPYADDAYAGIVNKPDVLLVASPRNVPLFQSFMKEIYRSHTRLTPVDTFYNMSFYKAETRTPNE